MLVLSRKPGESIVIGDSVRITILEVRNNRVRLGIEAPRNVTVHRQEVLGSICRNASEDEKWGKLEVVESRCEAKILKLDGRQWIPVEYMEQLLLRSQSEEDTIPDGMIQKMALIAAKAIILSLDAAPTTALTRNDLMRLPR